MIIPKLVRLGELYKANATFSVPRYQRSFDWGKGEVTEMIADLKDAKEMKSSMFLGTFVFDVSNKDEIKIVDGQQRITSFTLLLIACRQRAKELGLFRLAQEIQQKISFTDQCSGDMISERIKVSSSISDVFNHICDESWTGEFPVKIGVKQVKRQTAKLKGLYNYFVNQINVFDEENLKDFMRAIYDTYVIEIDIQDELEAFDIFERTNARGLSLGVADLLKNYLYAKNGDNEVYIEEKWIDITNNAGNTLQRMLKYFWVSRNGYVNKRELYRELKEYGNREGAKFLADALFDFSSYYLAIRSDDERIVKEWLEQESCPQIFSNSSYLKSIVDSFRGMNHFKITQHYPLIYSIISAYKRTSKEKSETNVLLRIIQNIEKYHFINNQICDRVGNEIEKPYAEFSERFYKTDDFISASNDLTKLLKEKLASKEEFESRFVEIEYQSVSLANLCYIFNKINNHDLKPTEWVRIYDPDKSITQKDFNTEHFLSQHPDFEVSLEDMELVDNIGNLFIISRHTNSHLQNKPPQEKIELLKDRGRRFKYVMDFVEEFEKSSGKWGKKEIQKRAAELARLAYIKVWNIQ